MVQPQSNPENNRQATPLDHLLDLLKNRRSRRFGLGMKMPSGPMAYASRYPGVRLTEEEEALLVFSAAGITGYALGDLDYSAGQGGTILAGTVGRTIPSGDAIHTCGLIVINADATYYIKRPQDWLATEIPGLVQLAERDNYLELYRRSRVSIGQGGRYPPVHPFMNINCNQWSLYDPSSTYFLPVADLTFMYINALLEIFNEYNGAFIRDERSWFRPAGVLSYTRTRGGHLESDLKAERTLTIQQLETMVEEFVSVEMGMMIQNLMLMTQALGLGGFPHWAAHPYGWFNTLGFQMQPVRASRYFNLPLPLRWLAGIFHKDPVIPVVTGLTQASGPVIAPYCPPNFPDMATAVRAVADQKWGPTGIFREGASNSAWKDPGKIAGAAPTISQKALDTTIAYCDYVYRHYRRFPAYPMPLRTLLGFQVNHLDLEFYDRFYPSGVLSESQRNHFNEWHQPAKNA